MFIFLYRVAVELPAVMLSQKFGDVEGVCTRIKIAGDGNAKVAGGGVCSAGTFLFTQLPESRNKKRPPARRQEVSLLAILFNDGHNGYCVRRCHFFGRNASFASNIRLSWKCSSNVISFSSLYLTFFL